MIKYLLIILPLWAQAQETATGYKSRELYIGFSGDGGNYNEAYGRGALREYLPGAHPTVYVGLNALAATDTTKIEAENYSNQSGIQVVACSEGGKAVGYVDAGDWVEYKITPGTYDVQQRIACAYIGSRLSMGGITVNIPLTGSYTVWTTITTRMTLIGTTFRITALTNGWDLNWINFIPIKTIANAGPDIYIEFPVDSIEIKGSGNGTPVWRALQTGSNGVLTTNSYNAMARGLYKCTYLYELAVTGPSGIVRDTVKVTANFNPWGNFAGPYPFGVLGTMNIFNNGTMNVKQ